MKKITLLLGITLLMMSCGEDQQTKVCDCKMLYDEASAIADEAEENGEDWVDALQEAHKASGGKFEECEAFHKELGDKEFHEMSKNCK